MIIKETLNIEGKTYVRTYSDLGFKIKKVGINETYEEAYDLPSVKVEYVETNEIIIKPEDEILEREESENETI